MDNDNDDANTTSYRYAAERILDKLQSNFGDQFKVYFFGDPFAIPISQLPCIVVDTDSTIDKLGSTGHDRVLTTIIVKVILNKRDDFAGDVADSVTKRKLLDYIAARDATTKQYLPGTVMGILRTYLTLDNQLINMESETRYGIVERNVAPGMESLTAEGQVTVTTEELIQVDNRQ